MYNSKKNTDGHIVRLFVYWKREILKQSIKYKELLSWDT